MISALGYMVVSSDRVGDWDAFATGLLGMQRVDRGVGVSAFRMDDRKQRLIVSRSAPATVIGWELPGAEALASLAARLSDQGVEITRGSRRLADERHVADLITFEDPAGNPLEAFHGAAVADAPFMPGRPISGFRTGPLGMGHAVLHVADTDMLLPFYRDVLGFAVTDWSRRPYPLYFLHVNGRHHSFAMVGSGRTGLHHFMVELGSLDDVGQGYDIAGVEEGRLAYGLGRHTNDHMTSFYAHSPSGFFIEYGWGARVIDPATWTAAETHDGSSLWGHERFHLDPEGRARLRTLRMQAAERGIQAPDPATRTGSIGCVWADAIVRQE